MGNTTMIFTVNALSLSAIVVVSAGFLIYKLIHNAKQDIEFRERIGRELGVNLQRHLRGEITDQQYKEGNEKILAMCKEYYQE